MADIISSRKVKCNYVQSYVKLEHQYWMWELFQRQILQMHSLFFRKTQNQSMPKQAVFANNFQW